VHLFSHKQLQKAWSELPLRVRDTPLREGRTPGLTLKLETLQPTGSYKIRAAYTRLKARRRDLTGVALSSSGNFASAFTWAAAELGAQAHLVVTPSVNQRKMDLAREHPCQVHLCGPTYESRFDTLENLAKQGIESIDHRTCQTVFLGHSTIGWECLRDVHLFERVLIPVSTGGLAIGVASALRGGGFKGEILGVQPAGNPTLFESWNAGVPIQRVGIETVCDALTATSVPQEAFSLLRDLLDDILLVQEQTVMRSVGFLALEEGIVAEPGACVGVAALLEEQRPWPGSLCIVTGRNLEAETLSRGLHAWSQG
jgi:threonine dehydratase